MEAVQILIPLIAFLINVATQILGIRYIPGIGLLRTIFLGMLVGMVCLILAEAYILYCYEEDTIGLISITIANIIIYTALSYCYFHFINLGETSRRIRIILEIYNSKDHALTMEEILERYNAEEVVRKRLDRLLSNRQIVERDGRLYIHSRLMLLISRIMVAMKVLLLGRRSEFDMEI